MSNNTYESSELRISKLGYALLGQLAREKRTGYELAQEFKHELKHFWNAQHSQIYPELQKLEAAKLIQGREIKQSARPDKKVYGLSRRGKSALVEWLRSPLPEAPVRSELHLRTHSSHIASPTSAKAFYETELTKAEAQARTFEVLVNEMEQAFEGVPPVGTAAFSDYANLKFGLENRQQVVRWTRWLIDSLASA